MRCARGHYRPRNDAMTLLEVLLAAIVMAMLAGALFGALHVGFKAKDSANAAIDSTARLHLAMNMIEQDIRSTLPPGGTLAGDFQGFDDGGVSTLLLHTTIPARRDVQTPRADVQCVEYLDQPGDDDTFVLARYITTNLLSPSGFERIREVVCRDVTVFVLRYFDGVDWYDSWDSVEQQNTLPRAVEIELGIVTPQGVERSLSKVVPLIASSPPEDQQ